MQVGSTQFEGHAVRRLCIVGTGIAGARHARALRAVGDFELTLVDVDLASAEGLAREVDAEVSTDLDDTLSRVEAGVIAVPHAMLAGIAMRFADFGRHALLEKPMAVTLAQADQIIAAFAARGLVLMLGFVHRFRDEVIRARQLIGSGAIGRPVFLTEQFISGGDSDAPAWLWQRDAAGGGIMLYAGVHSIDRARFLLGEEAISVAASVDRQTHHGNVEDFCVADLTFASGIHAILVEGFLPHGSFGEWRTEVHGTDAALRIVTGKRLEFISTKDQWAEDCQPDLRFVRQDTEFVRAIEEEREPSVTGADGRTALAIALAAYESARLDRRVDVPALPAP